MSENPFDAKYTKDHEWVKVAGGIGTVGITEYAQHALTDIVFVELPEKGKKVEQKKSVAIVESVKSVSDIFAPVSGEIVEGNSRLTDSPQLVNTDPYGDGWIFKMKIGDKKELDALMDKKKYEEYLKTVSH